MMDNKGSQLSKLAAVVASALASRKSCDRHWARLLGVTNLALDLTQKHNSDARSHILNT